MGAIHRFEQRLEQMVTGAFARAFRSAVQPLEIASALQREIDNSAQILSRDRRLAPNDFMIDLSPTDFDRLSTYGETLSRELASMLHEHAQEQGYVFTGPVRLNFSKTDDLTTGRFRVRSAASAAVTPAPGQSVTDTAVRRAPMFLEINGVRHPVEPPGLVVGRGSNADLRIDDPGVSRRHVHFRLQSEPGEPGRPGDVRVAVLDLGSTNGTLVNGQRVQHAVVGDGAVVVIGGTRIHVGIPAPRSGPPPSGGPGDPRERPPSAQSSYGGPGQPSYGGPTPQAYPPQQPQRPPASGSTDPRSAPAYRPPAPRPDPGPHPPAGRMTGGSDRQPWTR